MLHILLLILKIIGITLGILIGIILLVLCAGLFVPLRYRIEAERTVGEGNPPIEVKAKLTWFLHFINIRLIYSSDLKLRLRILFFTIFRIPQKHKKDKNKSGRKSSEKSVRKSKAEKKNVESSNNDKEKVIINEDETKNNKDNSSIGANRAGDSETMPDSKVDLNSQNDDDEEDTEQKLTIKDKLLKIYEFFKNIRYTISKLCDRIKRIFENIEYYLDILKGDVFKSSFALCKGELGTILSYIKPRKIKADLIIGAGDPAATGQIISYYYAILYPYIGSDVTVVGDFDNKRIEGNIYIKGKVKLFTLLKAVIRIYFNKDIKALLGLFKKEDE